MAKKKIDIKEFSNNMIKNLNEKLGGKGKKVFYNLAEDKEDPAKIKRWYSTHSLSLDWICGAEYQGMPGGRMCEISGPESIGKSHICYQMARWIQEQGGISLYIDTELATSIPNLKDLGVDVSDRFIYAKVDSIEGAFEAIEEFLKEVAPLGQDYPIGIFWDSIGGIGSRKEREMAFDDIQIPGLNSKQITLGLRKIMPSINNSGALLVLVNQQYDILNANKYDSKKTETKGGRMIKYMASVRLGLKKVANVYPEEMDRKKAYSQGYKPCGIRVRASILKNKVASPFREMEFDIHFGKGVKEHMTIWDALVKVKEIELDGKIYQFSSGAWRKIKVFDKNENMLEEISFRLKETEEYVNKHKDIIHKCFNYIMKDVMKRDNTSSEYYSPQAEGIELVEEDDLIKDL